MLEIKKVLVNFRKRRLLTKTLYKMRFKDRKLDYTGQDIFCGLDVHKKKWKLTVCTNHVVMNPVSIERPFVKNATNYVNKKFPGGIYHAAYEAGFSGFWAQRELSAAGIETIVVHPADIPTTDKERDQKTDQRDSRKIATSLRSGELRGIYVPSQQAIKDRNVIRERSSVAKSERRVKHQIKSHLMFMGFEIPEDLEKRYWSGRFIKWLEQIETENKDIALGLKLKRLSMMRKQQLIAVKALRALSKQDRNKEVYDLLFSVPGVGLLTAMLLIGEIIDMSRFNSIDHLYSYVGFIPSSNCSGEKERFGGMTNRRNRWIMPSLVQASWIAIKSDTELLLKYEGYRKRMKAQKAIIKIARILLRRIRWVWMNKQKYQKAEC